MSKSLLRDRLSFEYGFAVRINDEPQGQYPVFGSNGITGFIDSYKVEGQGVIVGRKGSVGKVAYSNGSFTPTDTAYYLRLKDHLSDDLKFWFYYLPLLGLEKLNTHSAVPGLSREIAYLIEVDPPSKDTQQKIAAVLSSLDAKIELNNRINTELEAMAKTLYDYWFVQYDFPDINGKPYKSSGGKMVYNKKLNQEIPESWEVAKLGDWIDFKRGISYKSSDIQDTGVPFINLNSFALDGTFKIDGTKFFNGNFKEDSLLLEDELVIAITDVTRNADIIGKAYTIPNLFNQGVLISCDVAAVVSTKLDKYYLEMLFNSKPYHDYIKYFASGTLVLHLDLNGIKWFETLLPPDDLMGKYSSFRGSIYKNRTAHIMENQQLTQLRDWLLPMLMNGQVRVD